jgi:hypothetical protein
MTLQNEAADAEDRHKRLYASVEQGLSDIDDVLKEQRRTGVRR